jgi:hypothetical protein
MRQAPGRLGPKLWPDRGGRFIEGVVRFSLSVSQNRTLGVTLFVQVTRACNRNCHACGFNPFDPFCTDAARAENGQTFVIE